MPLKVGVIGAGRWGKNHVRVYNELDCELVGISDIDPKARKLAKDFGIRYFDEYTKMLPLVDAVSVVVPTNLHYRVVRECLDAGKHVLVEKPMTLSSSETAELIEIAGKKGLTLMGGYLFRFNSAVRELRNHIADAGKINYITARYVHSDKPPRKDCGVILNFATHLIDILSFVLGKEPRSVFCKKINRLSKEREDCAIIILDYGDFVANLEVTWFHPLKKRDMWVIGTREKIYADFLEQMLIRYPISVRDYNVLGGKEIHVEVRKNEPLKDEIAAFCRSAGKGVTNGNGSDYSIAVICEKCMESAEKGREVGLQWGRRRKT